MKKKLMWLLFLPLLFCYSMRASSIRKADLVVFSFDRPLQLHAFLESLEYYVTGLGTVTVIYRSSNDDFEGAYKILKEDFPTIYFLKQGNNPRADFKPLTLNATFDSPHHYIIFAVDDIVVKDFIDVAFDIFLLEEYKAYGVYYRLGLHLTRCYTRNKEQPLPKYNQLECDFYSWCFADGVHDWGYPNTVDMTLYRKKDIESAFRNLKYYAPNSLEGAWAGLAKNIKNKRGIFYEVSKVVNLPLNKVQQENQNITMNAYSPLELLRMFYDWFTIDYFSLFRVKNDACHFVCEVEFVTRG